VELVTLRVDFEGEHWDLSPGPDFTFGRAGDICIDESNLYLHRVVGLLRHRDGTWWLHNVGEWSELEIQTEKGSRHSMAPDTRVAILWPSEVRFKAGKARYMINVVPNDPPRRADTLRVIADAPSTNRFGIVTLNDEQRLLLAALSEHRLVNSVESVELPSNQVVANRLGWSLTKFNRKLDYLCRRLAKEGVIGLRAGRGERATARREHLVDHAISTGLITEVDLELLD
jgi:hypothetical protein